MAGSLSNTYGHALFEIAAESGSVDRLLEEAQTVLEVWNANPEVLGFYDHPKITPEEKQDFTKQCFGGRVSDDMTGFLSIAVRNGRQREIPQMLREMIREAKEYKKIGIVYVTTPFEISAAQKARLEKRILETTGYVKLETSYEVDSSLIGGIVIRIGDRVVDASIRTQLTGMEHDLLRMTV